MTAPPEWMAGNGMPWPLRQQDYRGDFAKTLPIVDAWADPLASLSNKSLFDRERPKECVPIYATRIRSRIL